MRELKVSDILTEYFKVIGQIERLIDKNPLLRGKFKSVSLKNRIHLLDSDKGSIYTVEEGLLSLRGIFYVKSEELESIYYRIIKDKSHGNNQIIVQICLTDDLVLVSDSKVYISIEIEDGHLAVCLRDRPRDKTFVLQEFWTPYDKTFLLEIEIFKEQISKYLFKMPKYLKELWERTDD